MIKAFEEIVAAVFPGEDSKLYICRLEQLYQPLWEIAPESEKAQLKAEILYCERHFAENTRLEKHLYKQPTFALALTMYAGVSFVLAKRRLQTGEKSLCAKYLGDILEQRLASDVVQPQVIETQKMLISECFLDFAYAEGSTDMMSFRLHRAAAGNAP